MVSIKGVLGGDRPKKCRFCERKEISNGFWVYWQEKLNDFVGTSKEFKMKMTKEMNGCAKCWEDIHIHDKEIQSARLKLYVQKPKLRAPPPTPESDLDVK